MRDEIERMIISGELGVGHRLNEQALAVRLGVSRGPVREARRLLERAGLLVEVAHKGVFVRELKHDDLLENYDVRAMLTGLLCAEVARRATKAQREMLGQQVERMQAAIEAEDATSYYTLNLGFHDALAAVSNHRLGGEIYDQLVKQSCLRRQMVLSPQASNDEHRAIMGAIDAGRAEDARRLGEAHVLEGKARWLAKQHIDAKAK